MDKRKIINWVWDKWREVGPGHIERRGYADLYPPGYTHKKRKRKVNRYKK